MNAAIRHRGPDDVGVWSDPGRGIFFGHHRLSILDLSAAGHQPMQSPRGSVVTFNGEIYNYRELKAGLPDISFRSDTDTEVMLHLYEREGKGFVRRFNGMFAFGLWDPHAEQLFLARDRVGIKPLYYTQKNGIFAFSSEIKALLTLPWVQAELDEEALYHFLTYSKAMPPRTMFKDIHKFRPGYSMVVGREGIRSYEPYWEVTYDNYDREPRASLEERLRAHLERSVRYRMISDVPVGAFLSGGVDSSAIVALMSRLTSHPVNTYSIGFEDAPGYDELEHARRIAGRYGTRHYERIVSPGDIQEFLPRVVEIYDEPLADATSIPIYFISQLAREQGSIVVLTGDGSDELFCGYRNWQRYARLYPYYRQFLKLPEPVKQFIARVYGIFDASAPEYEIFNRAVLGQEFFWGGARAFKESVKADVLGEAYRQRMAGINSYDEILYFRRLFDDLPKQGRKTGDVDWMCFLGLKNIVPDFYMYRADRLGMANAIELRVPFLDHELVDFALSIPGRHKVAHGEPKYILKKALEPVLPKEVLYRKKQGFCVPLREWGEEVMMDYLEMNLHDFCRDTGIFREEGLRHQIEQAKAGNTNYTNTLWNIYFLMSWFKKWLL